jgi:hypothetical protein
MQPALNRQSGVRLSGEEPHASVAQPARASRCQREGRGFEPRRVPSQSARRRCRFAPVAEWIEAPAFQAGHTGSIPVWGSPQKQADDGGLAERLLQRTVNPPPTGLRRFESCGRHCFGCRTWPATWVPKLRGQSAGLQHRRLWVRLPPSPPRGDSSTGQSSRLARGRLRVRPPLTPSLAFDALLPGSANGKPRDSGSRYGGSSPSPGTPPLGRARIAQLGERPAHIGEAAGSIPAPRITARFSSSIG